MLPDPPAPTVVVPVRDRREEVLRCLEALLGQDLTAAEVIVMDNGSVDGTAEACEKIAVTTRVPVRVERRPGAGVGALRNEGARLAGTEVVAFTDSDCRPAPGWLRAGAATMARDPGLGVLQGQTLPEPGVELGRWPATISVTQFSGQFETANLFVRRDALLATGGFLPDLAYWEDVAGGWGIVHAGWRYGFDATALVHHDVTHPPFVWWLRRAVVGPYGNAAAAVRREPRLRDHLLWGQVFVSPHSAAVALAAVGLALAPARRRALLLTLPYLVARDPRVLHPTAPRTTAERIVFDAAVLAGRARGSLRHRRLVL